MVKDNWTTALQRFMGAIYWGGNHEKKMGEPELPTLPRKRNNRNRGEDSMLPIGCDDEEDKEE